MNFEYRSYIPISLKPELEKVFFFNDSQERYREKIVEAVREFSKPMITAAGDRIFLAFEEPNVGQSLHIFSTAAEEARLIGGLLYSRDAEDRLTIVHIAVCQQCRKNIQNISQVFEDLRGIFRSIKGVRYLRVYYANSCLRV